MRATNTGAGTSAGEDWSLATRSRIRSAKKFRRNYCSDVLGYEFLGYRDVHRNHADQRSHWVALDFKVHIDRDRAQIGEPHKFDALGWFTLDALPDPVHSQFPAFLDLYRTRLG